MDIEQIVFRKLEAKYGHLGSFEILVSDLRGDGAILRELDARIESAIADFRFFINGVTAGEHDIPVAYACKSYLNHINYRGDLARVRRFIKTGRGSAALAEKRLTRLVSAILFKL